MEYFIIENAVNTCYIDSLLVSLFYKPVLPIDNILNKDLKNVVATYLQEYIKERFVKAIRSNKSVLRDDIEMIRVICSQIGWPTLQTKDKQDAHLDQQDVTEFFCFLLDTFEVEKINIQRYSLKNNQGEEVEPANKEVIPYIPLALPELSDESITIKKMLYDWQHNNFVNLNKKTTCLNSYIIMNSPSLLALAINRFNNEGHRIKTNVIIQKKIYINDKKLTEWTFHAAICHRGTSTKSGHYYSLINNSGNWYIFDDLNVPCMKLVKMDDPSITNMIKKECFFVLYVKK
ncbi:MAG: ubiquitin carboxyl-terminal hydrolase [Barrevirus sp.]|uniref:ubiquitinyl hydrolase 1 n=1 Tax=Barrevirus sp. TaxID=2487763 RepID=A0A3G4ZTG6_9VIRU|nr:MAG: ubiquitin carboxyl-terminal hydrolase [Barrevirus sp.]